MTAADHEASDTQARKTAQASFGYFASLHAHFAADADHAIEIAKEKADLLRRNEIKYQAYTYYTRSLIRAFFAYVEGTTFLMRQVALWAHERGELNLSDEELFLLTEGERGHAERRCRRFNSAHENLELGVKNFAAAFGADFTVNRQSAGWSYFRRAIRVRNRVVHPRSIESFYPDERDIKAVTEAIVWFYTQMRDLMASCRNRPVPNRAALTFPGGPANRRT